MHPIDPKIDCVFKALLGSESNRALLIHFLNAILGSTLAAPITAVEILNPYTHSSHYPDRIYRMNRIKNKMLKNPVNPVNPVNGYTTSANSSTTS